MGEAIGGVLALGVGVAISPVPIVGVVLMLATPRGRANAGAFLAGWVVGLALVGAIALLASGGAGAREAGRSAAWVNVLELALGIGLLAGAARRWRGRPRDDEVGDLPGWMRTIDRFTAGRSAALGIALSAVNPKNLVLTLAAAAAIAQTGASAGGEVVALLAFVVVATIGVGTPVAIRLAVPERSDEILDEIKLWMARNDATIMAVLCLLIGAKLIGDAVMGFSA